MQIDLNAFFLTDRLLHSVNVKSMIDLSLEWISIFNALVQRLGSVDSFSYRLDKTANRPAIWTAVAGFFPVCPCTCS